jgi:glycosyltransferase involved in cell wall biosynthesis
MKILHCFNMANDGWSAVKGLRAIGADAHLIIHRPAHVASLPHWEEGEIDMARIGNLYDPDWTILNESWRMPDYVHVWDLRRSRYPLSGPLNWLRRMPELADYDIVIGHFPFAKVALFYKLIHRKPYVIYDAGWIRYLHRYDFRSYRLARIGYRNAAKILFTNVDTYSMFVNAGYPPTQMLYTPFAIDMDLYRPSNPLATFDGSPLFFSPSRQDWPEKGNDMLLYAFQRYLKRQPHALLLLSEWGQSDVLSSRNYLDMTKDLVKQLGIEDSVKWLPVMPKQRLVELYNTADVVFDQYVFGALGTTSPEAMSCGKPVVAHVDPLLWTRWHGSAPPVAEARTAEEIYRQMVTLEDPRIREDYGRTGRTWIAENCEMKLVARQQLGICEELIRR